MDVRKALLGLTLLLLFGNGVAVAADFDKGLKAAQSGDFKTALIEWTPLAEQGDVDAQYNLGLMYSKGEGVPQNDKTAVKWHTKAAKQGNAKAQYSLAVYYYLGGPVPVSYLRSYMWTNLSEYNGNELGFWKETLTKVLTSTQIVNAQEMSIRCLESNYTDC